MDMPGTKQERAAALQWDRDERKAVMESLAKTQTLLRYAHTDFNRAFEPELVEAAVYEINSLQARYAYLLRRVKELGIIGAPVSVRKRELKPPA
jgi:hypothetical protein